MALGLGSRLKNAWNAFNQRDPTNWSDVGPGYYRRPDRQRYSPTNERSIIAAIYNRIALDAASVSVQHVRLDENGRYLEKINSDLNNCLSLEANMDQTGRAFIQDVVTSLLDEGQIAIVPVDTTMNPEKTDSYDIQSLRVGKITQWYPAHVKVEVYNELTGRKEQVTLSKRYVGIVENPFYAVMNESNGTLKRLASKLSTLDAIDSQLGAGKLDLIIQLPYVIKSDLRRQQAEQRKADIERQLTDSKYGIAYTDGTEKITQLNRPVENNLMGQVEYLTKLLFSQLSITQEILDGTADEATMLNYYNRTIGPIMEAITEEMKRKFLTKTARTQGQSIQYYRDPFKLAPMNNIAEIADKFTRNEILTSNEVRQIIGMKPSDDPKADELNNSNIADAKKDNRASQVTGEQREVTEVEKFLGKKFKMEGERSES